MNNKGPFPALNQLRSRPQSESHHPPHLKELFSEVPSLKLLQFLEQHMQPHYQTFSLVEVALMVDRYITGYLLKPEPVQQRQAVVGSVALPASPKLARNLSSNPSPSPSPLLQHEQAFQLLLEQLKTMFLYYSSPSLSYEMINEFVYNQQLNKLSNGELDEDYIQIGQKRARLDENLKLCIMPLAEEGVETKTTKIRQLVFRERKKGAELEAVFAVTTDYVRGVRIRPELIGIAADFSRKDNPDCWYRYEPELMRPKRSTVSVMGRVEEGVALSSAELKELRASSATNMEEKFSEQLLSILKASVSDNLLGMISLDQSFVVEPLPSGKGRMFQGYIGNLQRDVPVELALPATSKEKYQEILLFENYSDSEWLILNNKYLYFYRIPLPAENIVLAKQNNLHKVNTHSPNPLLLMCQRLPQGCVKAVLLRRPFLALMVEGNAVLIIKLIINSLGIFQGRPLRLQMNYFKLTNKIYNDIQFKTMCFNRAFNNIFLADFGAYLIRISFNPTYGDIEEEGIMHNRQHSLNLNQQMIRNSHAELKASRQAGRVRTVIQQAGEEDEGSEEGHIQVHYLKGPPAQEKNLFSLYKKQNSSPHTVIIKNQTRQVITFLATNHNFNTLVTYEAESYEKTTPGEFQGEKFREWGNRNKIKLWDIRHMTIYKTYDVSLELACLDLRANGLFALTADRGYLVFYPLNQDRKAIMGEGEQQAHDQASREVSQELQEVVLQGNSLYFSTLTSSFNKHSGLKVHRTHIYNLTLQKYPQLKLLQTLPSEITSLAVSSRLYVLENATQGVEASQLHIYNRLGLKQEVVIFSNPEAVSAEGKLNQENYSQQYKFLRRVDHPQFEVVVWNSDSLKMLGVSPEESYTIVFSSARLNHRTEGVERIRAIKDIQVIGNAMLVYCETTTKTKSALSTISELTSKTSQGNQRKSHGRGKTYEQVEHSIILISNKLDRVTYRLERISPHVKVLHMYNELVLTREEEGEYDCIRLLDVGEHGALEKVLFAGRFRRNTTERVRARDVEINEVIQDHNILLQELKEYSVRRAITLEDTRVAVSRSNKLVLLLAFKVETHYSDLVTRRQVRSQVEFMVYGRNISNELLNANYKISKIQVGKKTEKHLYEYQTSAARSESIFGHKILNVDDCLAISNYTEVDMHELNEALHRDSRRAHGIDITGKILSPKNINDSHTHDIYEVLSLRRDKLLYERFMKQPSQVAAINAFSFKVVEFNEDDLTATVAVSNKLMRTVAVYALEIDCTRREQIKGQLHESENDPQPFELKLQLEKIALLQVKSHREIREEQEVKRSEPGRKEEVQQVRLLEWSEGYKSAVEQLWEGTMTSIKQFVRSEHSENRRSVSLPPIALHKLHTLHVRKQELLKKKLSASERQVPPAVPKHLEGDGASLMFKKWTISQAIQMENQGRDANSNAQAKAVNRYVNRVLKSQEDTAQRVQELIKNTQRLKEASQREESRGGSPLSEQNSPTKVVTHLDNILRSSQIAKEANIRTYMQQRRVPTEDSKQDYYKFSRNDTNKSGLTLAVTDKGTTDRNTHRYPLPGNQTRTGNISKMSNNTHLTRGSRGGKASDNGSLDLKIQIKLDEIQDRSLSSIKSNNLKFYTPQRLKTNPDSPFQMGVLKTEQSRYNLSPEERQQQRILRLTTEPTQSPLRGNKPSQISFTLTPSQEVLPPKRSKEEKRFEDYKNNFSLMGYNKQEGRQVTEGGQAEGRDRSAGKETSERKESAVERLKRSEQVMNSIYLPEIASTKEKLLQKMKEKRSYVKTIQAHLNDSSLMTIRDGAKRKELIKKLYDYS